MTQKQSLAACTVRFNEMGLHMLAYHMKRAVKLVRTKTLIEAIH